MKELEVEWEEGKVCQMAFVVRNVYEAVERYWRELGFGPWYIWNLETPELTDLYSRGIKVESCGLRVALSQVGPMQVELVQPLYGFGIHREFLEQKGEGFHHIKIYYKDIPKALAEFKKKGIYPLQSGKFGEDIHVYLDTEKIYGIAWEIGNQAPLGSEPHDKYPK